MAEGYLATNELLTFGTDSLKQFVQEHPDKRGDALDTIRLLNSQKISADEINTERISHKRISGKTVISTCNALQNMVKYV